MNYMEQTWRMFFEAIPLVIAFVTVILSIFRGVTSADQYCKNTSWLFLTSAVLLIFAQSSWSWTLFIKHDILGTDSANVIWTLFNTIAMYSMIYVLKRQKP